MLQLSLFDADTASKKSVALPKLKIGDTVGKIVLGEVVTERISAIEGNTENGHWWYRMESGICWNVEECRMDIDAMCQEAEENRKLFFTIDIDPANVEKLVHILYPPRECNGRIFNAFVGIYDGMLLWKHDITFQFLEPVDKLDKEYIKKLKEIQFDALSHLGYPIDYQEVSAYPTIKRLYKCRDFSNYEKTIYAEAEYAVNNGVFLKEEET